MKTPMLIPLLSLLPLHSAGQGVVYNEHTPVAVSAVDNLWDFSSASSIGEHRAFSRMYGDTIYAETIADFRSSYHVSGDTLRLFIDESRTLAMMSDRRMKGYAYRSGDADTDTLRLSGVTPYYTVLHEGVMRNSVAGRGSVSFDGQSYMGGVTLWREERAFVQKLAGHDEFSGNVRTIRYRWMKDGNPLPIAIQYEIEADGEDGGLHQTYGALYIPDAGNAVTDGGNDIEAVPDWDAVLAATHTEWHDGTITVSNPYAFDGTTMAVDVTDIPGNLYVHIERIVSGPLDISLSTSGLHAGNYMVTLRMTETGAAHKQIIRIP